MIRKPAAITDGHMGRTVEVRGVLVGVIPRPHGQGADLTIRVPVDGDIDIKPE